MNGRCPGSASASAVSRTLYPTIPPRVNYATTELGKNVVELLDAIRVWSEGNFKEVLDARQTYDERSGREPQPIKS